MLMAVTVEVGYRTRDRHRACGSRGEERPQRGWWLYVAG